MASDHEELLVVMSEEPAGEAGAELPRRFAIVHAVSSRVFVIEPPPEASAADIAALPGVAAVGDPGVAPDVLEGLDEAEALFVEAWAKRRGAPEGQRRGEGLDWDADGFVPPDRPLEIDSDDQSA